MIHSHRGMYETPNAAVKRRFIFSVPPRTVQKQSPNESAQVLRKHEISEPWRSRTFFIGKNG